MERLSPYITAIAPVLLWSLGAATAEARAPQSPCSTAREAHTLQGRVAPTCCNREKPLGSNEDPAQPKTNKTKTQLPLPKSQEQKQMFGSKNRVLSMPPAHRATKGWADHLSHCAPPGRTPGHTPTLAPCTEPVSPCQPQGREPGNLLLVLAPLCSSRIPDKTLPEFLVWPLINFY